jgi:exodeoxyribonuclease V alpha subunit
MTIVENGDVGLDRYDASVAASAAGSLRAFNRAGILDSADVHIAHRLAQLAGVAGVAGEAVALGVAFAARAPRLGHVCVDLRTIRQTASRDIDLATDLDALPWPDPEAWLDALSQSPLVGQGSPLWLSGSNLYLNRLWLDERLVATELLARAERAVADIDLALLRDGLATLFREVDPKAEDPDHLQPLAAAAAVLQRVSVIAGGPGTGKTTTVARLLALLHQQALAQGANPPLVALAAPTGKAALRLEEAVRDEALRLDLDSGKEERLLELRGMTLHRLLGRAGGNRTRFRHNATNPLRHDVVVVDETSMVALSMMARLLEALRPDARLILVGDHEQLASVEAGAVLGDIVGPAARGLCMDQAVRARLEEVTGHPVPDTTMTARSPIGDGVVVLRHVRRHGGAIAGFARAVQAGNADAALAELTAEDSNVDWLALDPSDPATAERLDPIHDRAVESGRVVIEAAREGDAETALDALDGFRLLCAHRRGPEGVWAWTAHIERWLEIEVDGFKGREGWYLGRPLIVTENDYSLDLFNGDIGVVVKGALRPMEAAFRRGGTVLPVSTARLAAVDTVYAMTVHKSQGSQFKEVAFMLPSADSRILTRELLYTAVTRARERLILVGTEDLIRAAIERPITRASGLRQALWDEPG